MTYPKIIVTGDSISQLSFQAGGYGSALCDTYNGKVDIVNRGMGGYNSRQLLLKLEEGFVAASPEVRLFIINIGTNDSAIDSIQTISVQDYTANLEAIIRYIREHYSSASTILLTPGQLDSGRLTTWEETLEIPAPLRSPRRPENTAHYIDACIAVGRAAGVPVINCFQLHEEAMAAGATKDNLLTDGLHFTPAGYAPINAAIQREIERICPDLNPTTLETGFENFWLYGAEEGSAAHKAAPLFEQIRATAMKKIAQARAAGRMNLNDASKVPEVRTTNAIAVEWD